MASNSNCPVSLVIIEATTLPAGALSVGGSPSTDVSVTSTPGRKCSAGSTTVPLIRAVWAWAWITRGTAA